MDDTLYKLGWNVDELSRLNKECQMLYVEVTTILDRLMDQNVNAVQDNISRSLSTLQPRLCDFTKGVTSHKRTDATHILVTLISPSERNKKPYAVPVSCIPYASMQASQARVIVNDVIKEMHQRNMKVAGRIDNIHIITYNNMLHAGFVSDGEYNSFRYKGYTRPLSILQLRSDARKKYHVKGVRSMKAMLTPIGRY